MARIEAEIRSFVAKLLYGPAVITRRRGYFTKEAAAKTCSIVLTAIYSHVRANSPKCRTVSHEINPSHDLVQKARHFR